MSPPKSIRIKGFSTLSGKDKHPYLKDSFWLDPKNHFWRNGFHNVESYIRDFETVRIAEGIVVPKNKK